MALKESSGLVLQKFEELKKWQKLQEEKLRAEQEVQRELLMAAQRRMFEDYNRDFGGSSQCSYNDESLQNTTLESFPRIDSPVDASPPPERKTQTVKNGPAQPCVSFDEVPIPSPHKDFNELLGEKLRQGSDDRPKEGASSKIVKRPFLRKGQGLVKYRLNPDTKKPVPKPPPVSKPSIEKSINSTNKPSQFSVNQPANKNTEIPTQPPVHATWANVLSKNPTEQTQPKQFIARNISPDQQSWTQSDSEASPNKLVGANKMTKKELEDLRLFELLEQKADNSSFCSSSSTIIRLLEKSHQSTPNKTSARQRRLTLQDFQISPLRPPSAVDRSLHVRFADRDDYEFFKKPTADSDLDLSCDNSTDCGEPRNPLRNVPLHIGRDTDGQKIDSGLGRIDESDGNFHDSEAWSDGCASLGSESEDEAASVADKTIEDNASTEASKVEETTEKSLDASSTERLVRTAVEGVAYKSELLRKRLQELEAEIETFRKENASLTRAKRLHEVDVAAFAKEKKETERAFAEKQETLTALLDAERKKLQKDKKVFEKYYKELKNQPSKMEREEITALKLQVENLRDELVKKDSRWSATQVRTRDRLKHLEAENVTLKSRLADMKRQLQERQASLPNRASSRVTDTKVMHAINAQIGRIKPSDLRDAATAKRRSLPNKEPRSALLTNRPIWGARNPKPAPSAAPNMRRTKSVPDVRPLSPQAPRCKSAVRIDTCVLNGSETESDSESESERESDGGSTARIERLRQTVYDTYYNGPPEKPLKTFVVDLTKDKEVVEDVPHQDEDVPEYLTAIAKKIAHFKAKLDNDEKKPKDSRAGIEAEPNFGASLPPEWDSPKRTAEIGSPVYVTKIAEKDPSVNGTSMEVLRANKMSTEVEKPDGTSTEVVRPDGSREKTFPDGGKEIWYPNGNVKKVAGDKSTVKIVYFNGDVKETVAKDGLVRYYYAESGTWHSTYNDGTEVLEFANGQRERRTADGVSEITFPNGCVRIICADGRDEWISPDGTRVSTAHGETVARLANGQREIHTATHKRREYPDGTVKLVYRDGLQETRYANGRIRIKDKDGNLVMDSDDQGA